MKSFFTRSLFILPILSGVFFFSCSSDSGELTVTYTKANAIYGDLQEIRATPLISASRNLEDVGKIYLGNSFILLGEEEQGIHVYDNSNPEQPVSRMFMNIPGNREFYVAGDYLYAESYYDMLKINISNPFQPALEARIENAISSDILNGRGEALIGFNFEQVTEEVDLDSDLYSTIWDHGNIVYYDYELNFIPPSAVPSSFAGNSNNQSGSINRITELDGHVYVISKANLSVYETQQFTQVFQQIIGSQMETIYPLGDRLFIGTANSVEIFSVEDPSQPIYEGSFWHATSCDPVLPVTENIAYATLRTGEFAECPGDINALVVLDVSSEFGAFQINEIEMVSPFGLTVIGEHLYVGEGENGLKIFDVQELGFPELVRWNQQVTAYDVLPHPTDPNLLLITGPQGLEQYQLSTQDLQLQLLSSISF